MSVAGDNTAHLAVGAAGEAQALRYLADRGFRVLARNWRPAGPARAVELDLVGTIKKTLVFVEVKTRQTKPGSERGPLANFTRAKQRNMALAARAYVQEHACWDKPCRFDLVCVTFCPDRPPELEHYAHVIELDQLVGGGNATWQPW